MAQTIKLYVYIVALIVLAVDFGDHEKSMLAQARPQVNVVHADDHLAQLQEVKPVEDLSKLDYDSMKKRMEQRRNAEKVKAVAKVAQADELELPVESNDNQHMAGSMARRQISTYAADDHGVTAIA